MYNFKDMVGSSSRQVLVWGQLERDRLVKPQSLTRRKKDSDKKEVKHMEEIFLEKESSTVFPSLCCAMDMAWCFAKYQLGQKSNSDEVYN